MRSPTALITFLALALVAVGGLSAFAVATGNGSNETHPGPGAHPDNETAENHTAPARHNETDEQERHDELASARHAALDSFHENRTAAIKAYLAALNATRASFLESKAKVIDDCRAAHNATKGKDNETSREDFGHCVKDGLKPLIEKAHADIKAAQDALHDKLVALRTAALAQFGHDRDEVNARHHHG